MGTRPKESLRTQRSVNPFLDEIQLEDEILNRSVVATVSTTNNATSKKPYNPFLESSNDANDLLFNPFETRQEKATHEVTHEEPNFADFDSHFAALNSTDETQKRRTRKKLDHRETLSEPTLPRETSKSPSRKKHRELKASSEKDFNKKLSMADLERTLKDLKEPEPPRQTRQTRSSTFSLFSKDKRGKTQSTEKSKVRSQAFIKQGLLRQRKGALKKGTTSFYVLQERTLCVYDPQVASVFHKEEMKGKLQGVFYLTTNSKVEQTGKSGTKFILTLPEMTKEIILQAPSPAECYGWLRSLRQVLAALKQPQWECPMCTYSNPDTMETCKICSCPRNATAETFALKGETPDPQLWVCTNCTMTNASTNQVCEVCSAPKTNPKPHRESLSEGNRCIVCFENEIDVIILPCGHYCVCKQCSELLQKQCPLCRRSIQKIQKIFKAST